MLFKLRQFVNRANLTQSNRLPHLRSRQYLINQLRFTRQVQQYTSPALRAALGFLLWRVAKTHHRESRIAYRAGCPVSGRARGVSQRYGVARTKVKLFSSQGKLFGLRKSSW